MPDQPTPTPGPIDEDLVELTELTGEVFQGLDSLATFQGATSIVAEAIANGIAASEPFAVGDHGVVFRRPDGTLDIVDVRAHEDEPRLASFITARQRFVSVDSLARYIKRYQDPDATVAYITDAYGRGLQLLTSDNDIATVVIDDHPSAFNADLPPGRRAHIASLVLRPTEPAKRWGSALAAAAVSQEDFLDLVVDGITEIADPDGSVLRDLISDLHAIRTSEVESVIRTGGEGTITLKENVKLHAGTAARVSFPETMRVTFVPFVGQSVPVVLTVRIKPEVRNNHVVFTLACSHLEDALADVVGDLAATIAEHTGLNPLWQP